MATDAELHIIRIAEVGYSLRAGNLYPRWAPNFYHGHGYPIFNYYAPLTYHLGAWLTGMQPEHAVRGAWWLFVLAHILGALGAYLLGREFGGQGGGLLGAAVFAFSPYILLINPHLRGDLAEVFAVALFPWALWSWERLWHHGGRMIFLAAIACAAGTLLSHNLSGLTLMFVLLALSAWHWWVSKAPTHFGWPLLAGVLVMALTAYFWLPFLLERHWIQLDVAGDGHYDFRQHFVFLKELLSPLPRQDWRDTVIHAPMSAGILTPLLVLGGGTVAYVRSHNFRRVLFYVLFSALTFWLITPASRWLWELVPGLDFYQFPWRFLGPLAALVIPPTAATITWSVSEKLRALLTVSLMGLVLLLALPGLYPLPWEATWPLLTPAQMIEMELEGRWRGTTSTNDFVPQTVEMIPGPQPSVIASYAQPPVDRVNRYTLPQGAVVNIVPDVPWRQRFHVTSAQAFTLRLYLFYFPGWNAYIDGQPVPIDLAQPEGFITVPVPAGEHEVLLSFEDTPARAGGWWIAAGGLVVLGLVWRKLPTSTSTSPPSSPLEVRYTAVLLIGVILLKSVVFDPTGWLHYESPPGEARPATYSQAADWSGEIALLGFDLSRERMRPGQTLEVTLYWQAQQPLTETYQVFVHLVYPEGQIWAQSDHLNPGGFPTNLWPTDRYVRDKHRLELPEQLPPGPYQISIGLYTLYNQQRLEVRQAESGARADNVILLQAIHVRR